MSKPTRLLNYYLRTNLFLPVKIKVNSLTTALKVKPYTQKKFNSLKNKIKKKKELYL
jgi:hypothetical protein